MATSTTELTDSGRSGFVPRNPATPGRAVCGWTAGLRADAALGLGLGLGLALAACAVAGSQHRVEHGIDPPNTTTTPRVQQAFVWDVFGAALPAAPPMRPSMDDAGEDPVDPQLIARAKRDVSQGTAAYRAGEYTKAAEHLKNAIARYPFLPQAHLTLGKVLLIQGSAQHDPLLVGRARQMFEMARALDPDLRETDALLQLFDAGPAAPGGLPTRRSAELP